MRYETSVVERETEDGGKVYDATCQDTAIGVPCFQSTGWSSESSAKVRIKEHTYEHAEQVPSRELEAFRAGKTTEEYEEHVAKLVANNALPTGGDE